jgi:uncharacterized membrane protein
MNGYIVLIIFSVFVIIVFTAFLFGMSKGKKSERQDWEELEAKRAKDAADYRREKEKIMEEAFGDAEKKKAALGCGTAAERFDAVNGSLRDGRSAS